MVGSLRSYDRCCNGVITSKYVELYGRLEVICDDSKFVILREMVQVSFDLIGTNGFQVKGGNLFLFVCLFFVWYGGKIPVFLNICI